MVAIIVDHLNWGPSLFHILSGGGMLFASPAEGFFTISGIMVGYVYGPRIVRSFKSAAKKMWQRAFLLYSLSIVFTLCYTVIALIANSPALPPVWPRDGDSFLLNTFLARYSYGWTDFLPRYAVFMAVSPFVLWLITKGKAWLVAIASVAVWVLFHTTPLLLPFSSWEIIFIPSIIIGYYLPQLQSWMRSLPIRMQTNGRRLLWGTALVSFTISTVVQVILPMISGDTADLSSVAGYFDKETVGIGRILLGVVWFWALYGFTRRYERHINRLTRGMLELFGTKSLYTYGMHGFVMFMLALFVPVPSGMNVLGSTLFAAAVVGIIYLLVASPTIARYLSYKYHVRRVHNLLGYNREYESA